MSGTLDAVAVPSALAEGRELRAVRVDGACMAPEIHSGDTVLVELGRAPQDGEVVVAEYAGRCLLKRWWDAGGGQVLLEANRAGDSQTVPVAEVAVVGVVISGVYDVLRQTRRQRLAVRRQLSDT